MIIERDVMYAQAANCLLWLQVGTTAFVWGVGAGGYAMRIEIATPTRLFRFRRRTK